MVVDPQGRVLAVNLKGDEAHTKIAELLGVSLVDLPMPNAPEPRSVQKAIEGYREDRDLVHGNARVYIAATPLSDRRIELVWSARGLPAGAGHWQNNYAVYVAPQRELFEPYRAELQVSHNFKEKWRKIAEAPAYEQRYEWDASPAGKLLWYRLILRDERGRVAGISDLAPGVTGTNLIADGDFESGAVSRPEGSSGEKGGSWGSVAHKNAGSKSYEGAELQVVEQSRPFSSGRHGIAATADDRVTVGPVLLPTDAGKRYILGAWIQVARGATTFERLAFDGDKRSIGLAESIRLPGANPWLFCVHRLATDDGMKGNPDDWAVSAPDRAGAMPANQRFVRPQFFVQDGKALVDDVFLLEYAEAEEGVLESLPLSEDVKRNEEASAVFSERREAAIAAEESGGN
jgi:hypothetical protein